MGFFATKDTRASLTTRLVFAVIASIISTLCFEGFRSILENYVFNWQTVVIFFAINLVTIFVISYFSLKILNSK